MIQDLVSHSISLLLNQASLLPNHRMLSQQWCWQLLNIISESHVKYCIAFFEIFNSSTSILLCPKHYKVWYPKIFSAADSFYPFLLEKIAIRFDCSFMSELQQIFWPQEIRNVINYVHNKQILVLKLNEYEWNLSDTSNVCKGVNAYLTFLCFFGKIWLV